MLLGFPKSSSAKPEGRQGFHLLYQIPQIFVTCSTLPFEPQRVQSSEGTCGCARAGPGCPAPPAPPGLMVGLAPHLGKHLSCPRAIPQGNNMHTSPSLQGNRNGSSESYWKPLSLFWSTFISVDVLVFFKALSPHAHNDPHGQ